jgi:xanthine dehydrogenase accessory factor
MRDLLASVTEALDAGRACVYCSVVETRGSTPQKAGAAMLVFADGSQAGTLGGGCVEAEVKRLALRTLAGDGASQPQLSTFCLDDNYGWDDGLICGGRMSIVAQPLDRGGTHGAYFQRFHALVESGAGCTEAVVIQGESIGSRCLFDAASRLVAQLGTPPATSMAGGLVPLTKRPHAWQAQGVAYLPVLPRITLLLVGGGHVAQAVGKLAAEVDFEIWVLDDRAAFASAERFPVARRRFVGDIGAELQRLQPQIGPSIYTLIVTRGHAHDEEALFHLATTPAGYVGMIGSKRKIRMIFEDLRARGIPSDALACVHAPLGLPIGSQTVPEIAVSIVAELIACRNLGVPSLPLPSAGTGDLPAPPDAYRAVNVNENG